MSSTDITPLELNNIIVKMRKVINQSKLRCCRKLIQQLNRLRNNCGEAQTEKKCRKIERISEEIKSIKKVSNDEISKFSLLNAKSFEELTKNNPSTSQLALYKVSTCEILMQFVDEFREKRPTWPIEVPFILQRLGLQYKSRKNSNKIAPKEDKTKRNSSKIKKNHIKNEKIADEMSEGKIIDDTEEKIVNDEEEEKSIQDDGDEQKIVQDEEKGKIVRKKKEKKNVRKKKEIVKSTKKKVKKMQVNFDENEEKMIEKSPERSSILSDEAKVPIIKEKTIRGGRIGQMELRKLNLDEISTEEFLPSISSPMDRTEFVHLPKRKKTRRNAGEFDPFFVQDDDEFENGPLKIVSSLKDDPDDLIPRRNHNDDASEDGRKRKNNVKSHFSSSLRGRGPPRRNIPSRKGRNSNANLEPLGRPETDRQPRQNQEKSFENRRTRREMLRKEAERKRETESLHPSWQAKRNQKNILLPSSGKKITFSDD